MGVVATDALDSDDPIGATVHKLHERTSWARSSLGSAELIQASGKYYQAPGNDGGVQHVYTAAAATADGEYAEAVIDCKSDVGALGVGVRVNSAADAGYFFMRFAGAWRLYRLVGNAFTLLASTTGSLSTGSHTLRITVTGTGSSVALACTLDGSALSALDSADTSGSRITSPGYCGVYSDTAASTTTGLHLDSIQLVEPGGAGPVITGPSGSATGPTQATIGVATDTAPTTTPISYQILAAATAAPDAPTIAGAPTGTISTGSAGALTKDITSLTTNTAVKVHFAQGTTSNVVSSASFTPNTLASSGSLSAQSATAGGSITWAGVTPDSLITNHGNGSGSWSIVSSAGFSVAPSINSSTGVLSGGTASSAGSYSPQIRYTDSSTVPGAQTVTHTLSLTVSSAGTAPSISSHPSSQSVTAGGTATFSVSASGSGTLTYQWQRNGSDISGANSSSYTTPTTTVTGGTANSGDTYRCVVTGDTSPPATSNSATLTVNAAATYSALVGPFSPDGTEYAPGTTVYWSLRMGNIGALGTGAEGSAVVNEDGQITVSHSVAGRCTVQVSAIPPGTVDDSRPVMTQIVVLA